MSYATFDVELYQELIEEEYPNTCSPFKTGKSKNKEESPMNETRTYLRNRLNEVFSDGRAILAKNFNLIEDDTPQFAEAFVERIQSGKFQLPTQDKDTGLTAYGTGPYGIIFRDPANVADPTGFEAALKLLKAQRTEAHDTVNVLGEVEALAALKSFQSYVQSLKPTVVVAPPAT